MWRQPSVKNQTIIKLFCAIFGHCTDSLMGVKLHVLPSTFINKNHFPPDQEEEQRWDAIFSHKIHNFYYKIETFL